MSVAFSGCGKVLASASQDGTVKVWDAETGELRETFSRHKGTVHSVKFLPKCKMLLTGGRDGTMRIWDVK